MGQKAKAKEKKVKDEKFNFSEEVIIGLKRIDDTPVESKKNIKKQKKKPNNINRNEKPKVQVNKKNTKKRKNVRNKQKEAEIKKKKIIIKVIKWTSIVVILVGGGIGALLSPIFNIKTINVIGNSVVSTDKIISLSGLQLEQNMFKYKNSETVSNIKTNAYIDTVKVNKKFPDTIELVVLEREATYMIEFANAYAYINNQGYILEITDKKKDLPIIKGIKTEQENFHEGSRLCAEDLKKLGDVLKIMESATSNNVAKLITNIDITDSSNYVLYLKKNKKTVYLGDTSNLSTKMLWIIKFNEIEKKTEGEIFLNMNLNDDRNKPYFRKKV